MGPISPSLRSISFAKQDPADDGGPELAQSCQNAIQKRLFDQYARGDKPLHFEVAHGWACVEILATGWADEGGDCVLGFGAVVAAFAAATGDQTWTGRYASP
jgi:hypothetical protein